MRHSYTTSEHGTAGSTDAVLVTITDRDTREQMTVDVEVTYSALGNWPHLDVRDVGLSKARSLVAGSRFEPDSQLSVTLTTNGWVEKSRN